MREKGFFPQISSDLLKPLGSNPIDGTPIWGQKITPPTWFGAKCRRGESGVLDLSWLDFAFSGRPDFPSRARNEKSARSFSDRSFVVEVRAGRPCQTVFFYQDLERLSEVFGQMSAGTSGRKLPLAKFKHDRPSENLLRTLGSWTSAQQSSALLN